MPPMRVLDPDELADVLKYLNSVVGRQPSSAQN